MNYKKYFEDRWDKLLIFDKIRLYKLIEMLQYTILYIMITIPLSAFVEELFPNPDDSRSSGRIFVEVLLQSLIIVILVFYLQKIVKLLPFIFSIDKEYKKHKTSEYEGTVIIPLVFVGTQKNLLDKIHILRRRIVDFT